MPSLLTDSLHPGTAPAWLAGLVLLLALVLLWRLLRMLRRSHRERGSSSDVHRRAVHAQRQKTYEGDRWTKG